jgi:hypothetical protein
LDIGVELANEALAILSCFLRELRDESLDLIAVSIAECLGTAKIGGVRLNKI